MLNQNSVTWQSALASAFDNLEQLLAFLELSPEHLDFNALAVHNFPLRVPLSFAQCMQKGNPRDPLLRQVLPSQEELVDYPGYTLDPVGDLQASASVGVIHKYHGRALLITTGSCAVNCRYCFRRNFPYQELQLSKSQLHTTMAYLQSHSELSEVILSGGDPLLLNDARLQMLFEQLNSIAHIQRIRIHTRIPVVLPERVTPELLTLFSQSRAKVVIVLHANHAQELSEQVAAAARRLNSHQITLLNQSVLLKGVNDCAVILQQLSERLFECGVLPYYLHTLDRAQGTGHFALSSAQALELHQQLQKVLPGYLVPRLVTEQAGAAHKILLH